MKTSPVAGLVPIADMGGLFICSGDSIPGDGSLGIPK